MFAAKILDVKGCVCTHDRIVMNTIEGLSDPGARVRIARHVMVYLDALLLAQDQVSC